MSAAAMDMGEVRIQTANPWTVTSVVMLGMIMSIIDASIVNVAVPGTDSESLLMALDLRGIAASGGSACQSGSISPSHVLSAIGVGADMASAAVRMSLGSLTTDHCIDRVIEVFPALVAKARQLTAAE